MGGKHRMKSEGTSKKRVYIILVVMICLQLASIIYYFQFKKEGYHSDEMWSYGYANSYYLKDIFQDSQGNLTYVDDWYDADVLRDYIVVNEGEQFAYDSIYQNQIYDLSPPFHSMVLHTICSFFPGQFSKWFSFIINIGSFLITMLYLFKTAQLMKSDLFALCCCAVYGFSMGARDNFVYLRMYALCTAFVMVSIYNILCLLQKYRQSGKFCTVNLVVIFVISILSFLTHYYVVSYMGILTFGICAYAFLKREYKLAFGFGFLMLIAFVLSVVIFPAMFQVTESKVGSSVAVMDYNFKMRFQIISHLMLKRLFNLSVSVYPSGVLPIIVGVLLFIFVVSIPLLILLRNTRIAKWIKKYIYVVLCHPRRTCSYLLRRINWIYVILLMSVILQIIVVGEVSSVYGMGAMIDRYIFYTYPIVIILGLGIVYQVGIILVKKKKATYLLLSVICIWLVCINIYNSNIYTDFLFLRGEGTDVEDVIKDKNCIFIRNDAWMVTTMVPTLMCADEFAQLQYYDIENINDLYEEKKDEEVIVLFDASIKKNIEDDVNDMGVKMNVEGVSKSEKVNELYDIIIEKLEGLEPDTKMQHLTTQFFYNRKMEVYLVNP